MRINKKLNVRIALAIIWLVFTSSLTLWWMRFAYVMISKFEADSSQTQLVMRHQSMLFWEGVTLIALLIIGGSVLIYFILQEKRQSESIKNFLAAFTHDVKTRLAGVKLQAESLSIDNKDADLSTLINRLITDTSRLQVQVENSLFIGGEEEFKNKKVNRFMIEKFSLRQLLEMLSDSWPQIKLKITNPPNEDAVVIADRTAFENIITNLLHNSISHGMATQVEIQFSKKSDKRIAIQFLDNGTGFKGNVSDLGRKFYRNNPSSGSGLGLYTVIEALKFLDGNIMFQESDKSHGFGAVIELQGEITRETLGETKESDT
jgi:signal transduction histidine kinase